MKLLNGFMCLSINGGNRISYTYDDVNDQGEPISTNNKASFYVVDQDLMTHVEAIRNKLMERLGE